MFLTAVTLYLGALVVVGAWRSRQVRTGDDFLVAGRTLPARVLVFTLLSTWIGSGSLFAGAGLGYRAGFPALWQSAGAWVGIALVYFIAPRVRRLAQYTVPDILELRFGPAARILGTLTTVLAYTTIAAYQFRGGGRLLELVAGIDPRTGALLTATFCVVYTAMAGMLSIAYLDIANGSVMVVGVTLAVAFLVSDAGGLTAALGSLRPEQVSLFGELSPQAALALFFPTLFLLLGEANMYQKFFSAKNERAARRAVIGWIVGTIVVETLIDSVGVFGSVAVPGLDTAGSESIVINVALQALPTGLGILLVCGAAAIVVSTANSFLLTPATNLMRDVYQRFVNPGATDRQVLAYTRLMVVALGAVGYIAGNFFPTILAMALWAYTMYGAGITPALLAALVWPRATPTGGVASILVGMTTTLVWEIVGLARAEDGVAAYPFGVETVYPALTLSIVTLVVVSLATRPAADRAVTP
ncbi:MAG: sodium:solute symporter family protein [Vicinamibacterales bacterium]|jgi:SSS family solute:Na+ symporter/sodium/proline symporter|nr:sodium:solute symporter [Acidobacteriota bacterium]MDP7294256.1 sodium:solute symporter family protein [Vicinamibacterales bacterium]MDP7470938.1 sodium:solute symporter family protein [Vicinamibacterales bacterium]MDP7673057.1 sodium:solute symporter family protein [Vicinamibacterales bacterium]HJO38615.1 sodium:solute symporter family protein [Vicinamibacterales bacterium]|tara:strand:+ start:2349 stop:3764 length:1416 start_codon:yes stop_codon:yes gene_type:complete